jgi:DNA polymerase-4
VSIKVRYADFTTINRSRTLASPTDVAREVYDTATALYAALALDRPRIRLVGVRVEGLAQAGDAPHQLTFGEREHGWREAEQAVDAAVRRFGSGAVRPAALVPGEGRPGAGDRARAGTSGESPGTAHGVDPDRELPATSAERQSRGRTDR